MPRIEYRVPCPTCEETKSFNAKMCMECWKLRRRGSGSSAWKGGRRIGTDGYVELTGHHDHPNAMRRGQISEHTKVMSDHLGRPLRQGETVHHRNGVRHDNRIENLELWSKSHPPGQRVVDKIAWAIEFLGQYGYRCEGPLDVA